MARDGARTRERILESAERLVLERGLAATSVDDVLAAAETSKGAFFHHFPSKAHLARTLVERYAAADVAYLEEAMTSAEALTDDPAQQLVAFLRRFEADADGIVAESPSCLYVSYLFDRQLFDDGTNDIIAAAMRAWRDRILQKLEAAARLHPPRAALDLRALADQVVTIFEGAFLLTRAMTEPHLMRDQLELARRQLALLFDVAAD